MFKQVLLLCLVASCYGGAIKSNVRRLGNIFPSGKIVGGDNANIKDYPWQITLDYAGSLLCGGTIINENTIVCAGHCVDDFPIEDLSVRVGSGKLDQGEKKAIAKIFQHPKYDYYTIDYDISILKLAKNLTFSDSIQPCKVGTEEPQEGDTIRITGWGTTEEGENNLPEQLQEVTVPVVSREKCNTAYSNIDAEITDRMICAGETGKDSCQGDSGGPAINKNNELVGIVSWGYGCARKGYPGVYTNVANEDMQKFINNHK